MTISLDLSNPAHVAAFCTLFLLWTALCIAGSDPECWASFLVFAIMALALLGLIVSLCTLVFNAL